MSIDMTLQKWAIFYNGGLWGKSLSLSDQAEFFSWLYKKNVDTHPERFS